MGFRLFAVFLLAGIMFEKAFLCVASGMENAHIKDTIKKGTAPAACVVPHQPAEVTSAKSSQNGGGRRRRPH